MLTQAYNEYADSQKSCYFDEASNKNIDDYVIAQAPRYKSELLQMAKDDVYPIIGKHPLGGWLNHFTIKECKWYDANFTEQIRTLRPNWIKG